MSRQDVDINMHSKIQVERKGRVSEAMVAGASPRLSDSGTVREVRRFCCHTRDRRERASLVSVLLPSYIVLMNLLRRSPEFVIRTLRPYGPPCVSKARWSSSGPQKNSKTLPSFSLQGKVSHADFFPTQKLVDYRATGLPCHRSRSRTWKRVLSCFYAVVSILLRLLHL